MKITYRKESVENCSGRAVLIELQVLGSKDLAGLVQRNRENSK